MGRVLHLGAVHQGIVSIVPSNSSFEYNVRMSCNCNLVLRRLWATLCGSVLHPFKEQLCSLARLWLKNVKQSPVPFSVRIVSSPLVVADSISDRIGTYIWKYWKTILISIAVFFITYIVYYNPPVSLVAFLQYAVTFMWGLVWWILGWVNGVVVVTLNVIYVSAVISVAMSKLVAQN